MVEQLDHLVGVVCGLVNDGQVEKPAREGANNKVRLKPACLKKNK